MNTKRLIKRSSRRAPLLISATDLETPDFDTAPLSTTIFAKDTENKIATSYSEEEYIDSSKKFSSLKSSLDKVNAVTQEIYARSSSPQGTIRKLVSFIPIFLTILFACTFLLHLSLKITKMGAKSKRGEFFKPSPSLLSQGVKKCAVFIVRIRIMVNEILSSAS